MNFEHIQSADGLPIGFARVGSGRALVIVHGSLTVAEDWLPVANALCASHTVYVMDRRGRGHSSDHGKPYSFQREIEDIAAVVQAAGPEAALFGHSSGGGTLLAYALQSGFAGDLILYEPGHAIAGRWFSREFLAPIEALLEAGHAEDALALIYATLGGESTADEVERLRKTSHWRLQLSLVAQLMREMRSLEGFAPTVEECAKLGARVTLLVGTETPYAMQCGSAAPLVGRIRGLTLLPIKGQGHNCHLWDPGLMAQLILKAMTMSASLAVDQRRHTL
jgi:pimeloyl-ACP methyl ester carboxylesterase